MTTNLTGYNKLGASALLGQTRLGWAYDETLPTAQSLAVTGLALTSEAGVSVTSGTASLITSTYIPAIAHGKVLDMGVGSYAYTGYAPTLEEGDAITAGSAALTTIGYAPSVEAGVGLTVVTQAYTVAGYAPLPEGGQDRTAGLTAYTTATYTAAVEGGASPEVAVGAIAATGYSPLLEQGNDFSILLGSVMLSSDAVSTLPTMLNAPSTNYGTVSTVTLDSIGHGNTTTTGTHTNYGTVAEILQ